MEITVHRKHSPQYMKIKFVICMRNVLFGGYG